MLPGLFRDASGLDLCLAESPKHHLNPNPGQLCDAESDQLLFGCNISCFNEFLESRIVESLGICVADQQVLTACYLQYLSNLTHHLQMTKCWDPSLA